MKYNQGETARMWVEIRDWDTNALTTPTSSTTVTLVDPEGTTAVGTLACSEDSTGKMYRDYTIGSTAAPGTWEGYFTATSGSIVTIEPFTFEVKE